MQAEQRAHGSARLPGAGVSMATPTRAATTALLLLLLLVAHRTTAASDTGRRRIKLELDEGVTTRNLHQPVRLPQR